LAIKKIQVNHDDGVNYDVLHYETQVKQVLTLDESGVANGNLEEALFTGKLMNAVNLNTVLANGMYRITAGINAPAGIVNANIYMMRVESVKIEGGVTVAHQEFYDHINHEAYHRTINGLTIGSWYKLGKSLTEKVDTIGSLSNLYTAQRGSIVDAINELSAFIQEDTEVGQASLQSQIDALESNMSTHNHVTQYLSLSGGTLTDTVAVTNNKSLAGKNTSGANLNIGKVNVTNEVVVGDITAKAIIQAKSGDLTLFDGTTKHKVYHSGNDGTGSGLDADTVDGVKGNLLARRDAVNYFNSDQFIEEGKSLVVRAPVGSSQAGSIYFRDGANNNKARILASVNGDVSIIANNITGHSFKADGTLLSSYGHKLDATSREVRFAIGKGVSDDGIGFYMNPNDDNFKLGDWKNNKVLMQADRTQAEIQFTNAIKVQGHKLSIQSSAPLNPQVGDVWIDI